MLRHSRDRAFLPRSRRPVHSTSIVPKSLTTDAMKAKTPLLAALSLLLSAAAGCKAPDLEQAPWTYAQAGGNALGASTGWAFYEAEAEIKGTGGALVGASSSDTIDLEPRYGGAIKYQHFFTDNFSLGAIAEFRRFDPDEANFGLVPGSTTSIQGDEFTTYHFLIAGRFFFDPMGSEGRWRPFVGLDLGYVPDVELDADVVLAPGLPPGKLELEGDEFYTLAPVVGVSYLWSDHLSFDFGAFYEFALDSTDDSGSLDVPVPGVGVVPSGFDAELEPEGLIVFAGLTYYL